MKKSRQLIIFAIIILVVIVASSVAAILWSNYQTSQSNKQSNSNGSTNSSSGSFQKTPAEQTADDADKLAYDGDVKGGVQKLDDAIQNTTNKQDLFTYYSRKATLLLNNNQLSDALTAAKKAYDIDSTSESAALVGQIAEQMGDKATAIEYYQNAIDHIDPTDPYAKSDKQDYQNKVNELKGGQ